MSRSNDYGDGRVVCALLAIGIAWGAHEVSAEAWLYFIAVYFFLAAVGP